MSYFDWSVANRLRYLSILIVLSGILGVIGAIQISKFAQMHELNALHLNHNHRFWIEISTFGQHEGASIQPIERQLALVRQQPIDCLDLLGPLERGLISIAGTSRSISLCEEDLRLADQTIEQVAQFEAGEVSRQRLITSLRLAGEQFNQNSVEFTPLVKRTVDTVSAYVVALVIAKAFIVGIGGWFLSNSVQRDYVRLQSAEADLDAANKELKNFVYRTSHDFKSPLLGIVGMARFVEEDIRSGNTHEALANIQRIQNNAESLESLAISTLELAKTDLADICVEPIDLELLLREMCSRLNGLHDKRPVQLILGDGVSGIVANTDSTHLLTAIENLVSNGIKYANSDREDAWVKIDADVLVDDSLEIIVSDNGIGFPEEYKDSVFEMFKQFHPERAKGTGLGLYIVRKSVERLGGVVSFQSSQNGTRFHINLPSHASAKHSKNEFAVAAQAIL